MDSFNSRDYNSGTRKKMLDILKTTVRPIAPILAWSCAAETAAFPKEYVRLEKSSDCLTNLCLNPLIMVTTTAVWPYYLVGQMRSIF